MRIAIDMQGLQTRASATRGVGRYTENIVRELLNLGSVHEFYLILNSAFPEAAVRIRKIFKNSLPEQNILTWHQSEDASHAHGDPSLIDAYEILREVYINTLRPDIIFSTNLQEGFAEPAVTSTKRIKSDALYCSVLHDVTPLFFPQFFSNRLEKTWYLNRLLYAKKSDILITVSNSARSNISEKLLIPTDSIKVIENGYDFRKFNASKPDGGKLNILKEKYNINNYYILYCGGADKHKNLLRLIKAFASLPLDRRKTTQLLLVGKEIIYDAPIVYLIKELRCSGDVLLGGYVADSELPDLIKGSLAFVFPSTHEGFGLPALEAMACGVAVIGSFQSGIAEVIDNEEATFDPLDFQSIAHKLDQVINDEKFRSRLAVRGLERAEHYSWKKSAEGLLKIFEDAIVVRGGRTVTNVDPMESFAENIAELSKSLSVSNLAHLAELAAASFAPKRKNKIFLDLSTIVIKDHRTGIQRVTRAIVVELLRANIEYFDVEAVYTAPDDLSFYSANRYLWDNQILTDSQSDNYVDMIGGDILIYLDLHPGVAITHKNDNAVLRSKGVKVYHLVHDLIPMQSPEKFWPGLCQEFATWLETISLSDGAICVSNSVARDLHNYLCRFGEKREDPFLIGWSHNGGDFLNSSPTVGLPPDADAVLRRLGGQSTFLMVGTIEPRKAHKQVLAAFEQLWAEGDDVTLAIFGRLGWLMDDFAAILKIHPEYGTRLFWIEGGSDEYLEKVYSACSCLIVASEAEGFGLPLVEAAKFGIPILARDIPIFREVAGNFAAYFVDSPEPIAVAMGVRGWLALKAGDFHPKSVDMPWLTWRQSAERFLAIVLSGDWSYETYGQGALRPYALQSCGSTRLIWNGFSPPEGDLRWSLTTDPSIGFDWGGDSELARLGLQLTTFGRQRITMLLNGVNFYGGVIEGQRQTIHVNLPDLLQGPNTLTFLVPDARPPGGGDPRNLAVAVHSLMVTSATPFQFGLDYLPNSHLFELDGFSNFEGAFTWTNGHKASVGTFAAETYDAVTLEIGAFALGAQNVTISVNGEPLFSNVVDANPRVIAMNLKSLERGYNIISIDLPDAHTPGGTDQRLLGLAIQFIRFTQEVPQRAKLPVQQGATV